MKPEAILALMPFAARVGVELTEATRERVEGRLPWAPERCTAGGVMHGGAIMTLADSAGAVCAFLNLPEGARTATTHSQTQLFRPITDGHATAVAIPLNVGRTAITVQTEVRDDAGRLVAQVTQTQAVIRD